MSLWVSQVISHRPVSGLKWSVGKLLLPLMLQSLEQQPDDLRCAPVWTSFNRNIKLLLLSSASDRLLLCVCCLWKIVCVRVLVDVSGIDKYLMSAGFNPFCGLLFHVNHTESVWIWNEIWTEGNSSYSSFSSSSSSSFSLKHVNAALVQAALLSSINPHSADCTAEKRRPPLDLFMHGGIISSSLLWAPQCCWTAVCFTDCQLTRCSGICCQSCLLSN